jgi:predicted dehydrogenase
VEYGSLQQRLDGAIKGWVVMRLERDEGKPQRYAAETQVDLRTRDIVVVGCGSQAVRHLNCLAKLRQSGRGRVAALVDPCAERLDTCRQVVAHHKLHERNHVLVAHTLADVASQLDLGSVIVDIVTPNRLHLATAAEAHGLGARRFMVEKPLAHTYADAKRFLGLNCQFCVLENYLFSDVTRAAQRLLAEEGWTPIFVKSEFSKDRRFDSANGRGTAAGYVPHVFTVEMPHQIAIVARLLGSFGRVVDAWHHDMILPDGRISNHGEGSITLVHSNGVPSYNFSCLQGFRHLPTTYRCVKVYCANDIKVFACYPTTIELDGAVLVYRGSKLLHREAFIDDSLRNALREAIDCLDSGQESPSSLQFGVEVLKILDRGRRIASNSP